MDVDRHLLVKTDKTGWQHWQLFSCLISLQFNSHIVCVPLLWLIVYLELCCSSNNCITYMFKIINVLLVTAHGWLIQLVSLLVCVQCVVIIMIVMHCKKPRRISGISVYRFLNVQLGTTDFTSGFKGTFDQLPQDRSPCILAIYLRRDSNPF